MQEVSLRSTKYFSQRQRLKLIIQSGGCVWVPTTDNGVTNPGLMQSHAGASFNPKDERDSIFRMVKDGTLGTAYGDGLTQMINQAGEIYTAARMYNSGSVALNGDLSNGNGATPCYVSDIANRLTGWVDADSKCGVYFPVPILNLTAEGDAKHRRWGRRHAKDLRHNQQNTSPLEGGSSVLTDDRDSL